MPSKIEVRSPDPDQAGMVYVEPGESQPFALEGSGSPPLLVVCNQLDLQTGLYVMHGVAQLPEVSPPPKYVEPKLLVMRLIAELGDDDPPVDLADLGVEVVEGQVILSHFSTLFGRN